MVNRNVQCVRLRLESLEGGTEVLHPPNFDWRDFNAERARRSFGLAHLQNGLSVTYIEDDCQSA